MSSSIPLFLLIFLILGQTHVLSDQVFRGIAYSITCSLPLLAVNTETGEGSVIELKMRAIYSPASRALLRHYSNTISDDTAISFELAILHAAIFSNGVPLLYEYELSAGTSVKGLSATLGFFTYILSVHSTGTCPKGVSATGLVLPGGVVAPVGFLEEKIRVAINVGLEKLFVPKVQLAKNETRPEQVRGVYTVLEVYEELMRVNLPTAFFNDTLLQEYHGLFQDAYVTIRDEAENVITKLRELRLENTTLSQILGYIERAEAAKNRGKYYTASSLAFTAFLHGLRLYLYALLGISSGEFTRVSRDLIRTTENDLNKSFKRAWELSGYVYRVESKGREMEYALDPVLLDILVNAYTRLHEANYYYNVARNSRSIEEFVHALTLAYSRLKTAETWLNVLERLAMYREPLEVPMVPIKGYEYVELMLDASLAYLAYALGPSIIVYDAPEPVNNGSANFVSRLGRMLFAAGLIQRGFNLTLDDYAVIRENIAKAISLLLSEVGVAPVQPVLLLDLVSDYLGYEDLGGAVGLLLLAFSHALTYLFLYRVSTWANQYGYLELKPAVDKSVILAPLALMATAGALLVLLSAISSRARQNRKE